ncbi:flavodoxin domain-containing protein [Embleya sp. NPDC020630]|uniref:flavodoxin domain-containing protein n=1 Tax=Embleya sp. NPDC020630 TaxID=3363979 RepID=UPI0037A594FF
MVNVLIAYASMHGSTRAIAHHIGERLRRRGLHARVGPMDKIEDLSSFDACVLGSAIHGGAWLPVATTFVNEHCVELADRPVWLFDVGLTRTLGGGFERHAPTPESVDKISAVAKVHDHHRFAGAIARKDLSLRRRLFFRAAGGHYGDFRDWAEIEAWADSIAAELVPQAPASGGTT